MILLKNPLKTRKKRRKMDYLKIVLIVLAIIALCILGLLMGCEPAYKPRHMRWDVEIYDPETGTEKVSQYMCPLVREFSEYPCECPERVEEEGRP